MQATNFFLITFLSFAPSISVCEYNWDSTASTNNVLTFANLMDDLIRFLLDSQPPAEHNLLEAKKNLGIKPRPDLNVTNFLDKFKNYATSVHPKNLVKVKQSEFQDFFKQLTELHPANDHPKSDKKHLKDAESQTNKDNHLSDDDESETELGPKKEHSLEHKISEFFNHNLQLPQINEWVTKNIINMHEHYHSLEQEKLKKFHFTFTKWAAELGHFHVLTNNNNNWDETYTNLRLVPDGNASSLYDQSFGNKIVEKFKNEIWNNEKRIAKTVLTQIMQLIFSFAVRIILSVKYCEAFKRMREIAEWQLKTLLSAHKKLSEENEGNNKTNGIFPFQIIVIEKPGNKYQYWWKKSLSPTDEKWSLYEPEQQKFINNFKFFLELSEHKLTFYGIYKLLDKIMETILSNESVKKKQQPLKIYTVLHEHFTSALSDIPAPSVIEATVTAAKEMLVKGTEEMMTTTRELMGAMTNQQNGTKEMNSKTNNINSKMNLINCAFIRFGKALTKRLPNGRYTNAFDDFVEEIEKICGGDDSHRSERLERHLFQEPLRHYASVIGTDTNEAKAVLDVCDDLWKDFLSINGKKPIIQITEIKEIKQLKLILTFFNDQKNVDKLNNYFPSFKIKTFEENINSLQNELLPILGQISSDYAIANNCELRKNSGIQLENFGEEGLLFGQILHYSLKMYSSSKDSEEVKYDQTHQLLTFPLTMAKRFIKRLFEFLKGFLLIRRRFMEKQRRIYKQKHHIGNVNKSPDSTDQNANDIEEADFLKAIQFITSKEEEEELKVEERQKTVLAKTNDHLFKWLFSFAIRLCIKIYGGKERGEKYLSKLSSAFKLATENDPQNLQLFFFKYKIKIEDEMVKINLPNWNLPYHVYLKNENELNEEENEESFNQWKTLLMKNDRK